MYTRDRANAYIKNNKNSVNLQYRQHIHLQPPIGWMNDPNGFVFRNGAIHLFYQFYPYDSVWGPMHWGHATTENGLIWTDLEVALAPDEAYDSSGCFSGTSLVVDNQLYLFYTGGYTHDDKAIQHQCMAVSDDGLLFEKKQTNPIITKKNSPSFVSEIDFRDPKIIYRKGVYYLFIVTKTSDNVGQLLLYTSCNLDDWSFKSVVFTGDEKLGEMFECPDYLEIDGKSVLIISAIQMPKEKYRYQNKCACLYMVGQMDWEKGTFTCESYDEIDGGLDFYAPQVTHLADGTPVLIAWMQMWDRTIPSHELGHKWAGCMTLIRKLSLKENCLYQTPMIDYETPYFSITDCATDFKAPLDSKPKVITIKNDNDCDFKLSFSNEQEAYFFEKKANLYTFDRSHLLVDIKGEEVGFNNATSYLSEYQNGNITIILDTSSVEIFLDDGRKTLSNRLFSQSVINQLTMTITKGNLTQFDVHHVKIADKK